MRSRRVEERAADILALWEARKDISLQELRVGLAEAGLVVSIAGLHRFFARRGITIGLGRDYQDLYGDYARIREVEESGALLVRPDVYIGWRATSLSETAHGDLRTALSAILGRGGSPTDMADAVTASDTSHPSGKFDEMEQAHFP